MEFISISKLFRFHSFVLLEEGDLENREILIFKNIHKNPKLISDILNECESKKIASFKKLIFVTTDKNMSFSEENKEAIASLVKLAHKCTGEVTFFYYKFSFELIKNLILGSQTGCYFSFCGCKAIYEDVESPLRKSSTEHQKFKDHPIVNQHNTLDFTTIGDGCIKQSS